MVKAIALALVASVCTATSSLCQRVGAGAHKPTGFDPALLFRLARRPVWLAGIASMIAGFGFQVTALRFGPLALVQPILVLELPLVFGYLALLSSRRVRLRDWLAVVAMSAGLGLFLLSASPSGGRLHAPGALWWLAGLASAGAVLLGIAVSFGLGVFGRRSAGTGARRAAVLGISAGLAWGFEAAVIKEFSSHLGDGAAAVLGNWSVYVLVGAGAASLLLASHALAAGPLAASQPGFTIVDPLAASLLGMFLFGERMQAGPIDLAGEAAGLALLVIGVCVLSHSHLIHGEDGLARPARPAHREASESVSARMLTLISRLTFTSGLDFGPEGARMAAGATTLEEGPGLGGRGRNYKWIALSNTTLGVLMVTINQSILLISLPDLFRGIKLNPLQPSNTSYFLWTFMGFMLVTAVLVVSLGRVGDMYGRVKMYNLGFAVFTFFSIMLSITWLTGVPGAWWIIIMRIFQGIGGAFLFANSSAILTDAFPAYERGKAMGINGIAAVSGSFIGLILGGVLAPVQWRLVFLVSVPFGVFGTFWAYLKLKDNGVRVDAKIDWLGNALFAIGLISLLTGIVYSLLPYGGHPTGWGNPWVLTAVFGGIAVLVLFGWVETKVKAPMFRLSLFKIKAFTAGNIAGLLGALGRGGLQFMLILWLQGIWLPQHGYSFSQTPLWAGIYMIPLTVGFLFIGPVAGIMSDRYGARVFATAGLLLSGVSFVLLELLPINFSYIWFALLILLFAVGMGLFFSPNQAAVMNSLPPDQRGAGAGMLNTFQNSAQVLSMGLFFTIVTLGLAAELPSHLYQGLTAAGVAPGPAHLVASEPPIGSLFSAFLGYNPIQELLAPTGALNHLSPQQVSYVTGRSFFPHLIEQPFAHGMHLAFTFAAIATGIAVVFSVIRPKQYHHHTAEPLIEELAGGAAENAELVGLDEPAALADAEGVEADTAGRRGRAHGDG